MDPSQAESMIASWVNTEYARSAGVQARSIKTRMPARRQTTPGRRGRDCGVTSRSGIREERATAVVSLNYRDRCQLRIQIRQSLRKNGFITRILSVVQFPHHSGTGEKDGFLLAN